MKVSRVSVVGVVTHHGAGQFGDQIPFEARYSALALTGPESQSFAYTTGNG